MPVTYKQILEILKQFWYELKHQRGSHQRWYKWNLWITVPKHKELAPKTAISILKEIANQNNVDYKEIVKEFKLKL